MKEKSYTASKGCMHTPKPPQFAHVDKSSFPKVINEQSLSSYCRKYKNEISSGIKRDSPRFASVTLSTTRNLVMQISATTSFGMMTDYMSGIRKKNIQKTITPISWRIISDMTARDEDILVATSLQG